MKFDKINNFTPPNKKKGNSKWHNLVWGDRDQESSYHVSSMPDEYLLDKYTLVSSWNANHYHSGVMQPTWIEAFQSEMNVRGIDYEIY